jgi:alkylation response protein AidB-like acyl-CoA dehydrogenase
VIIDSMTTTSASTTQVRPTPAPQPNRDALEAWAAELGDVLAANAARHDAEGSWVEGSYRHLVDAGMLALAVPTELGGTGATLSDVAAVLRTLARHCGSTALAMAMHQHATLFLAWRYRRGMPGAEEVLRSIARDRIVLATAGGADFTTPTGNATRVDGGYRVSGHKRFVSQSVAATVLSALFPTDDGDERLVVSATIPLDHPQVKIHHNWDTLGMRGTASNDVTIDGVFVPDEQVGPLRPYGVIDAPLQIIGTFAMPAITAVYLGISESAAAEAIRRSTVHDDPLVQRAIGRMTTGLRVAAWALDGALAVAGDDPDPSMETFAAMAAAKLQVATTGVEVCDLAMEVAGGSAFFKGSVIERSYRDVRAAKFHPLTPDRTLLHAGRLALDLPCDVI